MSTFTLSALPAWLAWKNAPTEYRTVPAGSLTIIAGPKTDWFIDPAGGAPNANAPAALFTPPDTDFILSAKVRVEFGATFDAGVLFVHVSDTVWAKLCFEYSPQNKPMIVSVVTRGSSDDCNAVTIDGNEVWLRVSRHGSTFAYHYSTDGGYWHMVRYFALGAGDGLRAGFLSQSPTGQGCTSIFSEITYRPGRIADLRSGE